MLGKTRLEDKKAAAAETVQWFEASARINRVLSRYCLAKPAPISWDGAHHPLKRGLLHEERVVSEALAAEIDFWRGALKRETETIAKLIGSESLLAAFSPIVSEIASLLPSTPGPAAASFFPALPAPKPAQRMVKAVTGPLYVEIDPSFEPTYSMLKSPVPGFGQTVEENVPYFWGLAIRESLAADLCALSIFEYDAMPLDFYCDMAKQAWDEMRHSTFFFDLAVKLLPDLQNALPADDPLQDNIQRFLATGKGLPIPKERNLYEAILNANLVERLILLHRDTETPGITRIKEKIHSPFCRQRPEIAEALAIVLRDEVTHSQFGRTWLEYLVPERNARETAIETAELLRGVFLLASFAHHGEVRLGDLIAHYAAGNAAPASAIQAVA
ncbi:MAG TPA: hypothetical protein VD713_00430 [Sphingomonadales bacterium]|nr:hypothetical protein [Sphingomonadales bacterium]